MKATPTRLAHGSGDAAAGTSRPANPIETTTGVLEDARALSDRVVKLAAQLSGYAHISADDTAALSGAGILDRLATNARETRSAIETAHEALDFIEGQIS